MHVIGALAHSDHVTSYAEVWIEIVAIDIQYKSKLSPPTRRCGLKLHRNIFSSSRMAVTSYAEVWIEIDA